jgi:ribosomal protein L11 methyltransferase
VTGTLEQAEPGFDIILANIQADVLCDLAVAIAAKLAPQGSAILSGVLCDQAEDVLAAYAAAGFVLRTRQDEGEWTGLLLHKAASPI